MVMHELFSHCTAPCATVRQIVTGGLYSYLVPPLSATATI
jgi:hypothetical protein